MSFVCFRSRQTTLSSSEDDKQDSSPAAPSHIVGKKRRAKNSFADVTDRSKRSRVNELLAPAVQLANEQGETRSKDQTALSTAVGRYLEGEPKVSSFANSKGTINSGLLKRAAAEYRRAVDAANRTRISQ
jgi:hypothetical protein